MVFKKNKKQHAVVYVLALFAFSLGIFFLSPTSVHAGLGDLLGDTVGSAFKALLYGVFVMIGWLASIAITLFEWAVNPDYMSGQSGLLNRASVYTMWQFIRDFFNLFFILTLLYTAFTIVFQIAGNYKKTLLSIVLAALFVNFSFPITRVIIDVTNVPMYYFINQIGATQDGTNQKDYLGTVLSASQIQDILIPGSKGGIGNVDFTSMGVSQILMAIVFLFIFSISLLVLAVLFVIRVAALLILLIFSSVGFAASIIPGLGKYGSMWWDKLWQYTFFGPAAALMLMVATRFFAEISKDNTVKQFVDSATANTAPAAAGFISSMAMFTVPMIMLWMAIGLATSMSIMGAGAVAGQGQKFLKAVGRKAYNNPVGRGLYGGAKKAAMDGKILGGEYGKIPRVGKYLTGNYWAAPSKVEAGLKGGVVGRMGGAKTELSKLHATAVNKAVKENKDNQVNRSILLGDLESNDAVERQAAALTLAENGEIRSTQDLTQALKAVASKLDEQGNPIYDESSADLALKIVDKAKDGATAGMKKEDYEKIAGNSAFYVKDKNGNVEERDGKPVAAAALEALNSKLKKDGQVNARIEFEIERKVKKLKDAGPITPEQESSARTEVYKDLVGKMSAEDLAKQKDIYKQDAFKEYAKANINMGRMTEILKKASEKSNAEIQQGWAEVADEVRRHNTSGGGSSN